MDFMHEYLLYAFQTYQSCDPYLQPVRRAITTIYAQSYPLIAPYLDQIAQLAQSSSPILTVGIFVLFVLVLIQILNLVRRIIAFWVRLVVRLIFWAAVVLAISLVWQRGVGRTAQDLMEWGQELSAVWWTEYEKYDGLRQQPKGRGGATRYRGSNGRTGAAGARAGW